MEDLLWVATDREPVVDPEEYAQEEEDFIYSQECEKEIRKMDEAGEQPVQTQEQQDDKPVGLLFKLFSIQSELEMIAKDSKNEHFKYKYVSEPQLLTHIKPLLKRYRLLVTCDQEELVIDKILTTKKTGQDTTTTEKSTAKVTNRYTIYDVDTAEQISIRMSGYEEGDKCAFKASTGANKYFWLRLLQIHTGDDPENDDKAKQNNQPITGQRWEGFKKSIIKLAEAYHVHPDQIYQMMGHAPLQSIKTNAQLSAWYQQAEAMLKGASPA